MDRLVHQKGVIPKPLVVHDHMIVAVSVDLSRKLIDVATKRFLRTRSYALHTLNLAKQFLIVNGIGLP